MRINGHISKPEGTIGLSTAFENSQVKREFCGIAAVFSSKPTNVSSKLFRMLRALQHRGQESAGIAIERSGRHYIEKHIGLVEPEGAKWLSLEAANLGIGHVRYSTTGESSLANAHPITVYNEQMPISIAHNGNLIDTGIRRELIDNGARLATTTDSELIIHSILRYLDSNLIDSVINGLLPLYGAYCICMMIGKKLIIARDPWGFKPLYMSHLSNEWVIASEPIALAQLGITEYREIKRGEVILFDGDCAQSRIIPRKAKAANCIFELIYFSSPKSRIFGESVDQFRKKLGMQLAIAEIKKFDIAIPIPRSGAIYAKGFADRYNIPFENGIISNDSVSRSFLQPENEIRTNVARKKLIAVPEIVRGKKIVLIDDSLIRGTSSKIAVAIVRAAGAKEVHLRLASPEIKWPCFFGIDIPTQSELISAKYDSAEIDSIIDSDSTAFLSLRKLKSCVAEPKKYCYACFTGRYPFKLPSDNSKRRRE
jgi:amidophosphoribosyltransferase